MIANLLTTKKAAGLASSYGWLRLPELDTPLRIAWEKPNGDICYVAIRGPLRVIRLKDLIAEVNRLIPIHAIKQPPRLR